MMFIRSVFIVFFTIWPIFGDANAADKYMQIQMLQQQIESLSAQRATQYEELTKCEKNSNTYKIVGVTTMSAAGIGLLVNAKLQKRLNELKSVTVGGKTLADNRSPEEKDDASQWVILDCEGDGYSGNQQECDSLASRLGI